MEKSKLLQLLRTFSKEEVRALAKFASTPFFSTRPEALSLLKTLEKHLFSGKVLPEKPRLFQQIFGKENYDDHRLRMAMSALLQTAEKFLVVRDLLQDEPVFQLRLGKILRAKNLKNQAEIALQTGYHALEKSTIRNAEYHYDLYRFEEEQYRSALDSPVVEVMNLQILSDRLDAAVVARKLWQGCFLLAHQARYNIPCDFGFLEKILPFAEKYRHFPAVSVYLNCYLALTEEAGNAHFQVFKTELMRHEALFLPDEVRDLYILAINFCTRRYNEGDTAFLRDQFDLYKVGFDKNYLLTEGVLSRFTYLNAATIGLLLREFGWVENLIRNHRQHLEPAYRESLFSFNMARLAYQKGAFGEALQLLQRAEYKETMLALAAKTIQLKIYYETQEHDLLESHLQAIAVFIRRKKVMGYHRENYLNLLYFVRKLLELNPLDKKARMAFREAVEQTKPLAEKEWLLQRW
ncbi:MAG: hypothetical protein SFV22_14640 [Saprospiraceae bacterium]|nr:hypothetical protein [Saprospiraceae bacterium]